LKCPGKGHCRVFSFLTTTEPPIEHSMSVTGRLITSLWAQVIICAAWQGKSSNGNYPSVSGDFGVRDPVRKRFIETNSEDCALAQRTQCPLKSCNQSLPFQQQSSEPKLRC
jgi:hypothetical protein